MHIPQDQAALEKLAEVICGDDKPWYKKGYQLPKYFRDAGLECVDHDGSTRKWWVLARLEEYTLASREALDRAVLRIADPREHRGSLANVPEVISVLNQILLADGLKVTLENGLPVLRPAELSETDFNGVSGSDPVQVFDPIDLPECLTRNELAELIRVRLNEACRNVTTGSYLGAVVLLGSALEGALWAFSEDRVQTTLDQSFLPNDSKGKPKSLNQLTLEELITISHAHGWIQKDAHDFAHILRDYRNLVHPLKQHRQGYNTPDLSTLRICVEVVRAAFEDLDDVD